MKLTSICVGRTYNMGNFTSRRFEISADLEHGEDEERAMAALSDICHAAALTVFRQERLRGYTDAKGYHELAPDQGAAVAAQEGDEVEIPF